MMKNFEKSIFEKKPETDDNDRVINLDSAQEYYALTAEIVDAKYGDRLTENDYKKFDDILKTIQDNKITKRIDVDWSAINKNNLLAIYQNIDEIVAKNPFLSERIKRFTQKIGLPFTASLMLFAFGCDNNIDKVKSIEEELGTEGQFASIQVEINNEVKGVVIEGKEETISRYDQDELALLKQQYNTPQEIINLATSACKIRNKFCRSKFDFNGNDAEIIKTLSDTANLALMDEYLKQLKDQSEKEQPPLILSGVKVVVNGIVKFYNLDVAMKRLNEDGLSKLSEAHYELLVLKKGELDKRYKEALEKLNEEKEKEYASLEEKLKNKEIKYKEYVEKYELLYREYDKKSSELYKENREEENKLYREFRNMTSKLVSNLKYIRQ